MNSVFLAALFSDASAPLPPTAMPVLDAGAHHRPEEGACLMEYVSVLAGQRFGDEPRCTPPGLGELARLVNDHIQDRQVRHRLAELAPGLIDPTRQVVARRPGARRIQPSPGGRRADACSGGRGGRSVTDPCVTATVVVCCLEVALVLSMLHPRPEPRHHHRLRSRLVRADTRRRRLQQRSRRRPRVQVRARWAERVGAPAPATSRVRSAFRALWRESAYLTGGERDAALAELLAEALERCVHLAAAGTDQQATAPVDELPEDRG